MKPKRQSLYRVIFLLPFVVAGFECRSAEVSEFARRCGVEAFIHSPRVFADSGDGKWKEYQNADKVPLGDPDWSEMAFMYRKSHSSILVTITGSGQDFAVYTSYCFDPAGNLTTLEREFRTAWGWGFAEHRSYHKAGHGTVKSHFFDTKRGQEIPRPSEADYVHEALQTKVFRKLTDLPFSGLIEQENTKE